MRSYLDVSAARRVPGFPQRRQKMLTTAERRHWHCQSQQLDQVEVERSAFDRNSRRERADFRVLISYHYTAELAQRARTDRRSVGKPWRGSLEECLVRCPWPSRRA